MNSRILNPILRAMLRPSASSCMNRAKELQTSSKRMSEVTTPLPARKPVGAFRGGIFGFLLGSTLAGGSVYYYILEEYKISNEMLTEDIYSLQASVQRVHAYVQILEEKIAMLEKKE